MRLLKAGLVSTVLVAGLAACGDLIDPQPPGPGTGPTIESFIATPSTIQSGGSATLSWEVSGATTLSIEPGVGDVTGSSSVSVSPTTTTEYTLTATNAQGSTTATTTVTVTDNGGPITPGDPPTGTFGVSTSPEGPFTNDLGDNISDPSDERIIRVPAGGSFYAQVEYTGSQPITGIVINLVNSSPEGLRGTLSTTEPVGGFTLAGEPTGDNCDLSGASTSVTCVYQINVASDVVNIDQLPGSGNEFAYVFRTQVTDAGGNTSNEPIRGYVIIE
ncbi:hypothetical protein [Truepera radiovictrix]|uniref:Uncharacterized protein n=1 Tax=Truepera radiovictrix (strain DSM 17093 / CIP 108686 / LMG 22925 / RQ-24) TaxID=649638 RepID=D7CUK2_TRURR|nr:hypothetical protein [Truepera radiovictrix]ADI15787.1 hypothetical protein Trad_2683 [Truepera radiovictrix DSM 17093]WMT58586.1 hypothetical protein RCV51_06480 [Truepera radiovictrix]